jgi:hypothetical protein
LQPKQSLLAALWNDPRYRRIGFGGARGGSKSGGIRRIMIARRLEFPMTTGLILRRSMKELKQSHLDKLFYEFPDLQRNYNVQDKKLVFPEVGSALYFASAPTAKDVADLCSSEYADIFPDEAQEFSQDELERMSGSLRCTSNSDITPKMIYSFMPGRSPSGLPPKGLPYLKRVFIDGILKPEEKQFHWAFLQAFSWDNIEWARGELKRDGIGHGEHQPGDDSCACQECVFYSWSEEERREYFLRRTDYGSDLLAITDKALRDAWLYGRWDVFEGQYFTNFKPARHNITRAEYLAWSKPWHKRWISGDWGFDHPHTIHLHEIDEHNRVITYAEDWGRGVGETELGKTITRMCAGHKFDAFPFSWDFGKLSPRDPAKRRSIGQMISESMPANLPKPHPAESVAGARVSGWRLMSQLLDSDMWQIVGEDCPKLVECIPSLVRDPDNTEDVLKVDFSENQIGDDPAESARYGLQFMLGASVKSRQVLLEERLRNVRRDFAGEMPKAQEGEVVTVKSLIEKLGGKVYRS